MNFIVFILAFLLGTGVMQAQDSHSSHWSYGGETGPEHWADLSPDYAACRDGRQQSPINITKPVQEKLDQIQFHYSRSALKLIDNGHTVQVTYPPGSYILVAGNKYELLQFHYHHPSEEAIEGKHYDLVIHFVHKDKAGHLAVAAVLFREGESNRAIKAIIDHLPPSSQEVDTGTTIDASDLLPSDKRYYTFPGSLTTPPCTEGVTWFVLQTPSTLSHAELDTLAKLYPNNARPVQSLNGRNLRAEK